MKELMSMPEKPILFSHPQYELDDGNKLKRKEDAGEQTIDEMESLLDAMTTFVQVCIPRVCVPCTVLYMPLRFPQSC